MAAKTETGRGYDKNRERSTVPLQGIPIDRYKLPDPDCEYFAFDSPKKVVFCASRRVENAFTFPVAV